MYLLFERSSRDRLIVSAGFESPDQNVSMNILTPFRERLWHYFSPGKLQTPVSPKPPSPKTEPPYKFQKGRFKAGQIRRQSLSPTVKRQKQHHDLDPVHDSEKSEDPDQSDDALSDIDEDGEPKAKRLQRLKEDPNNNDFEPEDEAEEPIADITQEEKDEYGIGVTIEPVAHATLEDPDYEGWTQDELDLHNRLNDRGVVPLLYSRWKIDFPTIPDVLFTDNKDEAYIKAEQGTEFRGRPHSNSYLFLVS